MLTVENIQREDLSFYERGRWVVKMKELGWTVSALAEETGIPNQSLFNWLEYYEEIERIKKFPVTGKDFKPEKLSLAGMLEVKRAPIPKEKKVELAVKAIKMERPPTAEIERITRFPFLLSVFSNAFFFKKQPKISLDCN